MSSIAELIKEQTDKIKVAKARFDAECEVGRSLLPEKVKDDIHWEGPLKAFKKHTKYAELIKAIYSQ